MKGGHNKKSVRVEFVMSEPEAELVKERMAELGITNLSAYLRKMAVDGYIIHLDMPLLSAPMWISTMSIITSLSTLLHWTVRKNFATSGVLPGQSGE